MTYTFDGFNWFMVLQRGDKLSEALKKFLTETKCDGAWLQGIGGVLQVELGCFDLAQKKHQWQQFDGFREVISLQGNISLNESGQPMFHLHGVFSDASFQTIGGHIKDLTVGVTLELFIHRSYRPLQRSSDDEVGIQVLQL